MSSFDNKEYILIKNCGIVYNVHCDKFKKVFGSHENEFSLFQDKTLYCLTRPRGAFESIVEYAVTGNLHFPENACPNMFLEELRFWHIPEDVISKCCLQKLRNSRRNDENIAGFEKMCKASSTNVDDDVNSRKFRTKIWRIVDNQENTVPAKVYLILSVIAILLSILNFHSPSSGAIATETTPNNTVLGRSATAQLTCPSAVPTTTPPSTNPIDVVVKCSKCFRKNPSKKPANMLRTIINGLRVYVTVDWCCVTSVTERIPTTNTRMGNDSQVGGMNITGRINVINDAKQTLKSLSKTVINKTEYNPKDLSATFCIEIAVLVFFTIDIILRLMTCPNRLGYFRSVVNSIEAVLLLSNYIQLALNLCDCVDYGNIGLQLLSCLQIFRVLRLFRLIRGIRAFKVLQYALMTSYKDLFVLLLYMVIAISLFANFIYFVEDAESFPSIPDAWWYCIVTMTTVGYGDIYPKSVFGKLIGSCCALCGVIMFALVIPVFVNTFLFVYQHADSVPVSKKYRKKSYDKIYPVGEITDPAMKIKY